MTVQLDLQQLRAKAVAVNNALMQGAPAHAADVYLTDADEEFYVASRPEIVLALLDRLEQAEKVIAEALDYTDPTTTSGWDITFGIRRRLSAYQENLGHDA